jgi:hypothetical protein
MSTNVLNQEDQEIDLSKNFQRGKKVFPKKLVNRYIKAFGLL